MTQETALKQLQLLQLADSALPIGATAHSFGLETLIVEGGLTVPQLTTVFQDYLLEVAPPEALFCRAAYRLGSLTAEADFAAAWEGLNARLSALKLAQESRTASATLGKRFLQLVCSLQAEPRLAAALRLGATDGVDLHHATAFGLVGWGLEIEEEATVTAYLQQGLAGLISACQRLMPLGQRQAAQLAWQLKPSLIAAAQLGQSGDLEGPAAYSGATLLDVAGMRHPQLATRLFIS
jgi:urease accessory protein